MIVPWRAIAALGLASLNVAQEGVSGPDRRALCDAFEFRQRFLQSVHVVVEIPDDQKPTPGAFLRDEVRVLGPDRWYLDSAHGAFRHDWHDDEVRNQTYIHGTDYRVFWPAGLGFETAVHAAGSRAPLRLASAPFFKFAGWWPTDANLPCPVEFGGVLDLNAIVHDPDYVLEPAVSEERGEPVWVLEKGGFDRIAFAVAKGFALRSRTWSDPTSGRPVMRVLVHSWDIVAPRLWIPTNGRIESYIHGDEGDPPESLIFDAVELRVNDSHPDDFVFVPPPGAFRFDRASDADYRQVVPGGFDHLERIVDSLREEFAARRAAAPAFLPRLSTVVLAFVALCALFGAWRGQRSRAARIALIPERS